MPGPPRRPLPRAVRLSTSNTTTQRDRTRGANSPRAGSEVGVAIRRSHRSATVISGHPTRPPGQTPDSSTVKTLIAQLWSWMSWVQVPSSTPASVLSRQKARTVVSSGPSALTKCPNLAARWEWKADRSRALPARLECAGLFDRGVRLAVPCGRPAGQNARSARLPATMSQRCGRQAVVNRNNVPAMSREQQRCAIVAVRRAGQTTSMAQRCCTPGRGRSGPQPLRDPGRG